MSTKEIIRQVAKKYGITPKQAEAEMKKAIRAGMASTDPAAQALWRQIAPDGKEPSIDVFLRFCSDRIQTKMEG